jgi:hypothetical protein|tara:strand:- start:899 stop:1072 length:174 start_codon:yes stop_codon:yes gene_type:complete
MEYFTLLISLAYTTALVFWLMNHFRAIYNHQFEITDIIISQLAKISDSKEYPQLEEE